MKINERNLGNQRMLNTNFIYGEFIRDAELYFALTLKIADDIIVDDIDDVMQIATDNNLVAVRVEDGYNVAYHRYNNVSDLREWLLEFGMEDDETEDLVQEIASGELYIDSYDIEVKYGLMITLVPITETLDEFNKFIEELLKVLLFKLDNEKLIDLRERNEGVQFRLKFATFIYHMAVNLFYLASRDATVSIQPENVIPVPYLVHMINTSYEISRDIAAIFLLLSHRFNDIVNKDGVVLDAR